MLFFVEPRPYYSLLFKPLAYKVRALKHLAVVGLYFPVFQMSNSTDLATLAINDSTDIRYVINMERISINRSRPQMSIGLIDQNKINTGIVKAISTFDKQIRDCILHFKANYQVPTWIDQDISFDEFMMNCSKWIHIQDDSVDDMLATIQHAAVDFRKEFLKNA